MCFLVESGAGGARINKFNLICWNQRENCVYSGGDFLYSRYLPKLARLNL